MNILVKSLMRLFLPALILSMPLPAAIGSRQDDNWPPLSYLKSDYRQVKVVAHVHVREAEIINTIGGYEDWHIVGDVVEPFKGKFRKGQIIEFYHGAEKGARKEMFLGERIVFLERNYVEKEKRWVFAVLENSTLPYTKNSVEKLRRIKRSAKAKSVTRI